MLELGEGLLHATAALFPEKMFRVCFDTREIADKMEKRNVSATVGNTASAARSPRP